MRACACALSLLLHRRQHRGALAARAGRGRRVAPCAALIAAAPHTRTRAPPPQARRSALYATKALLAPSWCADDDAPPHRVLLWDPDGRRAGPGPAGRAGGDAVPLLCALAAGNDELALTLLEAGADPVRGCTAAARGGGAASGGSRPCPHFLPPAPPPQLSRAPGGVGC